MRERPSGRRRRWLPRPTVRLRLTLLYGSLFLIAGAGLLAITYGLVAQDTTASAGAISIKAPAYFAKVPNQLFIASRALVLRASPGRGQASQTTVAGPPAPPASVRGGGIATTARSVGAPPNAGNVHVRGQGPGVEAVPPGLPPQLLATLRAYRANLTKSARKLRVSFAAGLNGINRTVRAQANVVVRHAKRAQLDALLTKSGVALGIMALLSIGLGWLMAGRALAPVRTMNSRVRRISEDNLHERVALQGRDDELKELADTFDGLLGRLQLAFESQRLFVANASHELRTPVTVERALIEVALADPNPSVDSLRETLGRVLVAGEQQERTIEALLTLARSQRGIEAHEPVDLAAAATEVVDESHPQAVQMTTDFEPAATIGDKALVERLIANLVTNAVDHNVPGGWVRASTGTSNGHATLTVENTGAVIEPAEAARLVEPFRRLNGNRTAPNGGGTGLGLSIVDAIAAAHGADLQIEPRDGGGLVVTVGFPRA
jgi:signal transduction histidine kinase